MARKIAVTGASGFIGRHLVSSLLDGGVEVLCLGRSLETLEICDARAQKYATDFSAQSLSDITAGYDGLIHLAGRRATREDGPDHIAPFTNTAIPMIDSLMTAACKNQISRVVTASSIAVYNTQNTAPYSEDTIPLPANHYGLSKLCAEYAADSWGRRNNISVAHARIAACYGHGEKGTPALMSFVNKARNKQQIKLTDGGRYQIDEIYVMDVVRALQIMIRSEASGAFNIGSGTGFSIRQIAETANEVFANPTPILIEPESEEGRGGHNRHMSIEKAHKKLSWAPIFSLKSGLEAMRIAAETNP